MRDQLTLKPFKPFNVRARVRPPERWIPDLIGCQQIGSEAVANSCPSCAAWRTAWLLQDGSARCYACGWIGAHADFAW